MAEQSRQWTGTGSSSSSQQYLRSPSRPMVADPSEILSLYDNDAMVTDNNQASTSNAAPPCLHPVAVAVAVPIENMVDEAVAQVSAVWDDSSAYRSGTTSASASAPAISSSSVEELDREAKVRAMGGVQRNESNQIHQERIPTLPDNAVSIVASGREQEERIATATAVGLIRAEEDYEYRQKCLESMRLGTALASNRAYEANVHAQRRHREGIEVDSTRNDYNQKLGIATRNRERSQGETETFDPYKQNSDQKGYEIGEYKVSEYKCEEYKSDYEYKSVYD